LSAFLLIDINLGFLTKGKLAAILIIPSSWGSQWAGHSPRIKESSGAVDEDFKKKKLLHQLHSPTSTMRQQLIFWRHCRGRVEDLCKGSFLHTYPLLCFIVLLYFIYFTCIVLYQKPKKN
jgi:hypothetical protein